MGDGFFKRRIPQLCTPAEAEALRMMLQTMQPAADYRRAVEPESEVLAELEADLRTFAAALADYDIRKARK